MSHRCYATDAGAKCLTFVDDELLLCNKHWRRLTKELQRDVYRTWQELNAPNPEEDRDLAGERYADYHRARTAAIAEASRP